MRCFSSGEMVPSVICRIGLTIRALPSRAWAAPIRPPRRSWSRLSTTIHVREAAALRVAAAAASSALPPAATTWAADRAAKPRAVPTVRESTTITGTLASRAAIRAAS